MRCHASSWLMGQAGMPAAADELLTSYSVARQQLRWSIQRLGLAKPVTGQAQGGWAHECKTPVRHCRSLISRPGLGQGCSDPAQGLGGLEQGLSSCWPAAQHEQPTNDIAEAC